MTMNMRYALVRSLFELGEFEKARAAAAGATQDEISSVADLAHYKAMLDVIADDEAGAIESLAWACRGNLNFLRPHQNIAARAAPGYLPNALDFICGTPGRLYDLCNFAGQRVTHVGRGEIGVDLYKTALKAQEQLRTSPPTLSSELESLLRQLEISFDELRIIPEEWTTQIGHLGMLDILFRLRELGWWSGKAVMVIASRTDRQQGFLHAAAGGFRQDSGGGRDGARHYCANQLVCLQRWCGLNFNAFRLPDGRVGVSMAGGRRARDRAIGKGSPQLTAARRIRSGLQLARTPHLAFELARREWGMKPTDWYVCLHVRDAAALPGTEWRRADPH